MRSSKLVKKHVKHKGMLITVSDYKKRMKA